MSKKKWLFNELDSIIDSEGWVCQRVTPTAMVLFRGTGPDPAYLKFRMAIERQIQEEERITRNSHDD